MGVNNLVAASSGGIKSVQRGLASASGNITITAVDISKSFVTVFGTTSSGAVAGTGALAAVNGTASGHSGSVSLGTATITFGVPGQTSNTATVGNTNARPVSTRTISANVSSQTVALNAATISGGTNNLVSGVVQGYLANSTTLTVSGACRWEVVEFN